MEAKADILRRAEERVRAEKIRNAGVATVILAVVAVTFWKSDIHPFLLVEKAPYMWNIVADMFTPAGTSCPASPPAAWRRCRSPSWEPSSRC
jgi:hypothetical protein